MSNYALQHKQMCVCIYILYIDMNMLTHVQSHHTHSIVQYTSVYYKMRISEKVKK